MRILNIYGQESEHLDAKIVGNKAGLIELQNAIYDAMKQGKATTTMYASDGEGYELTIEEHNDEWGCYAPKDSYWNKPESDPLYYREIDAKTAHIVAQEIIGELEERCPHTPDDAFAWIKRMCPGCFHAIKSKFLEGENG